jgi:hypothetical protein
MNGEEEECIYVYDTGEKGRSKETTRKIIT